MRSFFKNKNACNMRNRCSLKEKLWKEIDLNSILWISEKYTNIGNKFDLLTHQYLHVVCTATRWLDPAKSVIMRLIVFVLSEEWLVGEWAAMHSRWWETNSCKTSKTLFLAALNNLAEVFRTPVFFQKLKFTSKYHKITSGTRNLRATLINFWATFEQP